MTAVRAEQAGDAIRPDCLSSVQPTVSTQSKEDVAPELRQGCGVYLPLSVKCLFTHAFLHVSVKV